jgi:hypothetical protein
MSLDGGLTRYHRIGSPTDPARVLGDRPIECALCHAGKSVDALLSTMEDWWKQRYDRDVLVRAYGDLSAPVMRATLERGKPHEKAVALVALGQNKERSAGPLFAAELADPYPLLRQYAVDALRATYGDDCDIDLARDRATIDLAMDRCSKQAGFSIRSPPPAGSREEEREPAED